MTGNPVYPRGKNAQYPLDQGWMCLHASLEKMVKGKIPGLARNQTQFPGRPASNLVTVYLLSYSYFVHNIKMDVREMCYKKI
jgi:hypothetical protein